MTTEEIEVVFIDIDVPEVETRLKKIGAEKVQDILYRFTAFDYPDYRLDADNSWIRLRDNGTATKLAFKKRLGVSSQDGSTNDDGMEEIELTVESYDQMRLFLNRVGFVEKHSGEKKRTRWHDKDVTYDIDTWPGIPPLIEIEAASWDDVARATEQLGFDPEDQKICSVNQIYQLYGIDVNDYQEILFSGLVPKN